MKLWNIEKMEIWIPSFIFLIAAFLFVIFGFESPQFERFSSATPYSHRGICGEDLNVPEDHTLKGIYGIFRHGSRNPTKNRIRRLDDLQKHIKEYNYWIAKEYEWIKYWKNPFRTETAADLAIRGEKELAEIGERISNDYSSLFYEISQDDIRVRATSKQRAIESAVSLLGAVVDSMAVSHKKTFLEEISSVRNKVNILVEDDQHLRFYRYCPAHLKIRKDKSEEFRLKFIAQDGEINDLINAMPNKIAKRLGVWGQWPITMTDVRAMWTACRYEMVVYDVQNRWCSVFDQLDEEVLDFSEDVDSYWRKGYAFAINYKMSCPLLADIHHEIMKMTKDDAERFIDINVAHAETVLPLLSFLNLFRDEKHLDYSWTYEEARLRKWRGSIISPFATHLVIVLTEKRDEKGRIEYFVGLDLNGRLQPIKHCLDENDDPLLWCPIDRFFDPFIDEIETCDLEAMCDIDIEHFKNQMK